MDAARFYLDSADLGARAEVLPNPLVHGVTTNPTLLKRAGVAWRDLRGLIEAIFGLGARALHLQATGEGLLAAARLTTDGLGVTTTAVYQPEQVLFSARAGATYAAPYLGRLQDGGEDGLGVIGQMQALLDLYAPHPTRLLVASVRSREAVVQLLALGVGGLTLPPALFAELVSVPATDRAAATFLEDARSL